LVERRAFERPLLEARGELGEAWANVPPVVEGALEGRREGAGLDRGLEVARDEDEPAIAAVFEGGELHGGTSSPANQGRAIEREGDKAPLACWLSRRGLRSQSGEAGRRTP